MTSAGVSALMLATQLLVEPGERVVEVVPLWPNLQEIPRILGAKVDTVALKFSPSVGIGFAGINTKTETRHARAVSELTKQSHGWTVT